VVGVPFGTPYINSDIVINAPTGVGWQSIPAPNSPLPAQAAAATAICWRATSMVDTFCNQVLRATVANEQLTGPGAPRFGFMAGADQFMLTMRQWPISEILAIQYAHNRPPLLWDTVAPTAYLVNHPLVGAFTDTASATAPDGGWSIQLDPCEVGTSAGVFGGRAGRGRWRRNGLRLWVSYTNGWPHTSLTAPAAAAATTVSVDDVTGWVGASGFCYDGSATEQTSVSTVAANVPLGLPNGVGTAQTGPGTLTLSSPLAFAHEAGTLVSALPASVMQATILIATSQVLDSGIESITAQTLSGSTSLGGKGVSDLIGQIKDLLNPYRRVV
jgi:hypothetical protein